MKNFWQQLPSPIIVLAPMADVTDVAFRKMIAKYSAHERKDGSIGGPDVMWTEFVSADGLVRATPEGKEKLRADLKYDESERPIVAQLFSSNTEHMEEVAGLCRDMGFDGIDINMGCPDRSIERQGCGSAMINNPEIASDIIRATKRGAKDIPVSVKTRLGYNTDTMEDWISVLLKEEPDALTIHARTRKEMSKVPARLDRIKDAVGLRDAMGVSTKILGNGDVLSVNDAKVKVMQTGADGMMLGRAIFGNPWLFHPEKDAENVTLKEKLSVLVEHTHVFQQELGFKNFAIMKKHYKSYCTGFDGAKELRVALMETSNSNEVEVVVDTFLRDFSLAT